MRRRSQKFERLRFREWDERAFEAACSMLERLPVSGEGAGEGGAEWVRERVGGLLAGGEPLASPLAFFELQTEGDALWLRRVGPEASTPGAGAVRGPARLSLARVRRVAEGRYAVETTS